MGGATLLGTAGIPGLGEAAGDLSLLINQLSHQSTLGAARGRQERVLPIG